MRLRFASSLALGFSTLLLSACVESSSTPGSAGSPAEPAAVSENAISAAAPAEKLTKHDAALRFLTAFIRLDRNMALRYATPQAVNKLNWSRPHRGNIPYYDDKMILYFSGGLARVYFQEINGSYIISDLKVF